MKLVFDFNISQKLGVITNWFWAEVVYLVIYSAVEPFLHISYNSFRQRLYKA